VGGSTPQHGADRSNHEKRQTKCATAPHMREQYAKQQEMVAMREQMAAAQKPGPDGLPVFNLFVRTKPASVRTGHNCVLSLSRTQ